MKVQEYATQIISSRPYKYQTRLTLVKDLKRLGIWDLEVSEINSAMEQCMADTQGWTDPDAIAWMEDYCYQRSI